MEQGLGLYCGERSGLGHERSEEVREENGDLPGGIWQ